MNTSDKAISVSNKEYSQRSKEQKQKLDLKNKNSLVKYRYFYVFLIGGIIGTVYEELLTIVMHGHWSPRNGVLWLPFNPLYGVGALGFVLVLSRFKQWYHQVTYGALVGGSVEYLAHLFQELLTGTSSWNYNNAVMNVDGRTTVVFALAWGLMGFGFVRGIYPLVIKALNKIPYRLGNYITIFLMVVLGTVMVISFSALIRCYLSSMGYKPLTCIGKFFDKYMPKEYLQKHFVNMKFK